MFNINIMTENSNKTESKKTSTNSNKSTDTNSNVEQYETIRIIITYIVVFFWFIFYLRHE